jgi:hypothetical protein
MIKDKFSLFINKLEQSDKVMTKMEEKVSSIKPVITGFSIKQVSVCVLIFSTLFGIFGFGVGKISTDKSSEYRNDLKEATLQSQKDVISSLPKDYKMLYYIEKLRERGFVIDATDREGKVTLEIQPSQDAKIKSTGRNLHYEVRK